MNRRLDLSKLGGYPLTQADLNWMQTSYRGAFAAMSSLIGDNVIISGMVEAAGSVTAGWISLAGELLPFQAGVIGDGAFIIDETSVSLTFKDGVSKIVRFERVARFSSGGPYNYANLKRPGTIKEVWQRGDVKEIDCDASYLAANFDGTGLGINERVGWAICNGNNGTRNRKGRVAVQHDPSQTEFDVLGETGGAKTHSLTGSENGPHTHGMEWELNGTDGTPNGRVLTNPGDGESYGSGVSQTQSSGTGSPHNNLQPYIVSLFIQKL